LPPVGNPFTATLGYLFDTNSTLLTAEKMELRIGTSQQGASGTAMGASLGGSYNFNSTIGIGAEIISDGVLGTITSGNIALELNRAYGNFKLTGFLGGGYNFAAGAPQGEAGLRLSVIPLNSTSRMGVYTQLSAELTRDSLKSKQVSQRLEFGVFYPF
jgi:hypothetical protein